MIKTKFVFAVSFLAMMAVNVANAKIAATTYVDKGVETATNAANAAQLSANDASTAAGNAQTSADNAQDAAEAAQASANEAKASAEEANNAVATKQDAKTAVRVSVSGTAVGSSTLPVYVDANGVVKGITSYSGKAETAGTADRALADGSGNNIVTTYATKDYVEGQISTVSETNSNEISEVAQSVSDLSDVVDGKVAKKQGTTNAGKGLVVDGISGDLTLTDIATQAELDAVKTTANNAQTSTQVSTAITTAVNALDGTVTGTGSVVKAVTQTNGKVAVEKGLISDDDVATDAKIAASKISGLATVATSGSYSDLSNKPTIPTVNNATLTIQRNGAQIDTFTANASANKTINISVPTTVASLTDSGDYATKDYVEGQISTVSETNSNEISEVAQSVSDLSDVVDGLSTNKADKSSIGNATLTIENGATNTNLATFTANSSTAAKATIPAATPSVAGLAKIGVIPSGSATSTTYATIWVE